jgi:hypothetical protein
MGMHMVNYTVHVYASTSTWNPNSNILMPDRAQNDRPATCVIAQQYSSAIFVSLHFYCQWQKLGAFIKTVSIPFIFFKLFSPKLRNVKSRFFGDRWHTITGHTAAYNTSDFYSENPLLQPPPYRRKFSVLAHLQISWKKRHISLSHPHHFKIQSSSIRDVWRTIRQVHTNMARTETGAMHAMLIALERNLSLKTGA